MAHVYLSNIQSDSVGRVSLHHFHQTFSSPSYRNQSQTGKSKRSTCHRWWFGEHTEEWRCHPLAHHLGSCPGCCTWDCRNLRTIPELGRLARQIRSQSLGCRSEWGWLPRPPATKAFHKKKKHTTTAKTLQTNRTQRMPQVAMANSHVYCMKPGLKALHGSQFPASNETVSLFASTYTTSSCKRNFPSLETKTRIVSRPMICIQL